MLDILFGIWLICFGLYLIITNVFDLSAKKYKGNLHMWSSSIKLIMLGLMCVILSFGFIYGKSSLVEIVDGFLN